MGKRIDTDKYGQIDESRTKEAWRRIESKLKLLEFVRD
mgnify:CR=1 FL=1